MIIPLQEKGVAVKREKSKRDNRGAQKKGERRREVILKDADFQ